MNSNSNLNIHVPSAPAHLKITQGMWEDFLCDPALAARVILGFKFDAFQNIRLRYYWWVQEVEDHSGFSSGKTIVDWAFAQLRAILIPNQALGIYYPVFETGKKTFWTYYTACKSPLFHAQIGKLDHEGGETKRVAKTEGASSFECTYRNGNTLLLPAASFSRDAVTQASLRFNTIIVEEWTHIDAMGTGIDDQIIGRNTRECWNQNHPIWGNHFVYSAPAKTRMHPGHVRHQTIERSWRNGSPKSHSFGFCYKDFSNLPALSGKSFRETWRIDSTIKNRKSKTAKADWLGESLGVWAASGKGWYNEEGILQCVTQGRQRGVKPIIARNQLPPELVTSPLIYFFLGVDPAPSEGLRSDDGALVAAMARPKVLPDPRDKKWRMSENPADWWFDYIYAKRLTSKEKMSARQWSGVIHRLHQVFKFHKIVMDPNGGGIFVKRELMASRQMIMNIEREVTPIVDQDGGPNAVVRGDFILHLFKRGDPGIESLWPELKGDDLLNDAAHSEMKLAMEHLGVSWPMSYPEWRNESPDELKTWVEERMWATINLTVMTRQYNNIVVATKEDGTIAFTKNNARSFGAVGKKDFVSAGVNCYTAFRIFLQQDAWLLGIKPQNKGAIGGGVVGRMGNGRGMA